jgi:DNA-binding response OmpR family regulator
MHSRATFFRPMDHHTTRSIFLIEDDPYIADVIQQKFRSEHYAIIYAPDGGSAREMIKNDARVRSVSVILLDIVLPQVSGNELLKYIRSDHSFDAIPVVIVSNINEEEGDKDATQAGAQMYLVKANNTPSDIFSAVERAIEKGV